MKNAKITTLTQPYKIHFVYVVLLPLLMMVTSVSAQNFGVTLLGKLNEHSSKGYNDVWGYTAPDGKEYALLGTRQGMSVIDISDPTNPREVDFYPGSQSTWYDMKVYQHYAYSCNETSGLQIVDLSGLPNSTSLVQTWGSQASHNIYIDEDRALLFMEGPGGSSAPTQIYSLDDPENPQYITEFGGETHDFYALGNDVYVAEGRQGRISRYDYTNEGNVSLTGRFNFSNPGYVHNCWTTEDKKYMLTTEETAGKTVKLWDISDFDNAFMTDEYLAADDDGCRWAHNVLIHGTTCYISHYCEGLSILDFSDPNNIVEAALYDTDDAWGIYAFPNSNTVLISDIRSGLWVFEYERPTSGPNATFSTSKECGEVQFNANGSNIDSYDWDFGDGNGSNIANPSHVYTASGTYTVTLTVTQGGESNSSDRTVNIQLASKPQGDDVTICAGNTANLEASGSDGYAWYANANGGDAIGVGPEFETPELGQTTSYFVAGTLGGGTFNVGPTGTNIGDGGYFGEERGLIVDLYADIIWKSTKVTAETAGDKTIVVKEGSSQGNIVVQKTVTVPQGESVVDLDLEIPAGTNYYFSLDSDGPYDLFRNNDGVNYPYEIEGVMSIKESTASTPTGFYYYFYDNVVESAGSCESEREEIVVTVTAAPDKPVISRVGDVLSVDDNYVSYQWFIDGQEIPGATSNSYEATEDGTYHVVVSNGGDCEAESDELLVGVTSLTAFLEREFIKLYPNPTSDFIVIEVGKEELDLKYELMTSNAVLIDEGDVGPSTRLDLSNLSKGIYLIKLMSNDDSIVTKITLK